MKKFYLNPRETEAVGAWLKGQVRPLQICPTRWLALAYQLHFEAPYISTGELRAISDAISSGIIEVLAR
jgi:hypothetical protein